MLSALRGPGFAVFSFDLQLQEQPQPPCTLDLVRGYNLNWISCFLKHEIHDPSRAHSSLLASFCLSSVFVYFDSIQSQASAIVDFIGKTSHAVSIIFATDAVLKYKNFVRVENSSCICFQLSISLSAMSLFTTAIISIKCALWACVLNC